MTTYTLDRLDTGEHLSAYQVRDEVDRLDSIAEQAPVTGWTPGPDAIPDHLHDDLCRKVQPAEYADEPTPEAGPVPDTVEITKRINLHMASYRLMRHQEIKAELWHAEASRMWAEQGVASRVSERYTDRRDALLATYEAECERIKQSLTEPQVEYGGHVYTEAGGFVETAPAPPADRTGVENLARKDRERRQREQRAIAPAPAPAPEPAPKPERTPWWRREWVIGVGIVVAWAAFMTALVVLS